MSFLNALNECGRSISTFLPTVKLNDLTRDIQYPITNLKWVTTKFGQCIVAELEKEVQVFLPQRFTVKFEKLTQEELDGIVRDNISLIYRGQQVVGKFSNVHLLEFA